MSAPGHDDQNEVLGLDTPRDMPLSNSTSAQIPGQCLTAGNRSLFTAWFTVYLLFLPVFLLVLYIGFNKWKKPQSPASGGLNHSDIVTLNTVAMEITSITGACIMGYGFFHDNLKVLMVGANIVMMATVTGQVLFHSLTCVERYLAVVHPVTYLRLRGGGGVTVRNISVALVWILSLSNCVIAFLLSDQIANAHFDTISGLAASVTPVPLVVFCSVCVLRVLIRPKPGEAGGHTRQMDHSKRATAYTIVAILGALLLRLMVQSVNYTLFLTLSPKVSSCSLVLVYLCSALPSSLVLPLLFLHRAKKLPDCRSG